LDLEALKCLRLHTISSTVYSITHQHAVVNHGSESLNKVAMKPNLQCHKILIFKREKKIKFFKTNSASICLYGCENWNVIKDYILQK
jgi:hypothetical protein